MGKHKVKNKHLMLVEIADEIWLTKSEKNFDIKELDNWSYEYIRNINWKIYHNRSANETIFKPRFMKALNEYFTKREGGVNARDTIEELLYNHSYAPERWLHMQIFWRDKAFIEIN